jgi:hypothetical protein
MAAMIRNLVLMALLATPLAAAAQQHPKSTERCLQVRGRYAIYVQRDSLWVVGSKHLLWTTDDSLDEMLEKKGWEDWVVFGNFEICTDSTGSPLLLDNHSNVTIKSYKNLVFRKRE